MRPMMSRFCRPVSSSSMVALCPVTPILARTRSGSLITSKPATSARPASGRINVVRMRTVVVLPAPLRPSTAQTLRLAPAGLPAQGLDLAERSGQPLRSDRVLSHHTPS